MAKVLSVIAPEGYQDHEYGESKAVLEAAGHTVVTTSTVEIAQGKLDDSTEVDLLIFDVKPEEYDAVAFIGGPGCFAYFDDPMVQNLARQFDVMKKLVCAICAAPSILANAGLLEGKNVTCWEGESENLKTKGANYTGNEVEQDDRIITANGPEAARAFGEKICEALII